MGKYQHDTVIEGPPRDVNQMLGSIYGGVDVLPQPPGPEPPPLAVEQWRRKAPPVVRVLVQDNAAVVPLRESHTVMESPKPAIAEAPSPERLLLCRHELEEEPQPPPPTPLPRQRQQRERSPVAWRLAVAEQPARRNYGSADDPEPRPHRHHHLRLCRMSAQNPEGLVPNGLLFPGRLRHRLRPQADRHVDTMGTQLVDGRQRRVLDDGLESPMKKSSSPSLHWPPVELAQRKPHQYENRCLRKTDAAAAASNN